MRRVRKYEPFTAEHRHSSCNSWLNIAHNTAQTQDINKQSTRSSHKTVIIIIQKHDALGFSHIYGHNTWLWNWHNLRHVPPCWGLSVTNTSILNTVGRREAGKKGGLRVEAPQEGRQAHDKDRRAVHRAVGRSNTWVWTLRIEACASWHGQHGR